MRNYIAQWRCLIQRSGQRGKRWKLRHLHRWNSSCWCWNEFLTFYTPSSPANDSYTNKYMVSLRHSGIVWPTQGNSYCTRQRQESCGSSFCNQVGSHKGKWSSNMCASGSSQTWGTKSRCKLQSNFTCGGTIGDILGTSNKTEVRSGNYIHQSGWFN